MALSNSHLVLHAAAGKKNAVKSLIAVEYVGVKVKLVENFEMGVSNKTPEFLKMNPLGKVLVLETPEGPLFESNAIARHVSRLRSNKLLGTTLMEQSFVDQWIDFATTEIDVGTARWVYPRWGYSAEVEEYAITALKRSLVALNAHLATHTYLVGHSVTLADIVLVCNLTIGFKTVFSEEFMAEFPHVDRYFWTLVNHPEFKKHLGTVVKFERPLSPPPSKAPPQQTVKEISNPVEEKPVPAQKIYRL